MRKRCFAESRRSVQQNVVERLALDLDEWPEIWPSDDPAPVLVITIGGKEMEK